MIELYWREDSSHEWILEANCSSIPYMLNYLAHQTVFVGEFKAKRDGEIILSLKQD